MKNIARPVAQPVIIEMEEAEARALRNALTFVGTEGWSDQAKAALHGLVSVLPFGEYVKTYGGR